jgi:hypothetical protein
MHIHSLKEGDFGVLQRLVHLCANLIEIVLRNFTCALSKIRGIYPPSFFAVGILRTKSYRVVVLVVQ